MRARPLPGRAAGPPAAGAAEAAASAEALLVGLRCATAAAAAASAAWNAAVVASPGAPRVQLPPALLGPAHRSYDPRMPTCCRAPGNSPGSTVCGRSNRPPSNVLPICGRSGDTMRWLTEATPPPADRRGPTPAAACTVWGRASGVDLRPRSRAENGSAFRCAPSPRKDDDARAVCDPGTLEKGKGVGTASLRKDACVDHGEGDAADAGGSSSHWSSSSSSPQPVEAAEDRGGKGVWMRSTMPLSQSGVAGYARKSASGTSTSTSTSACASRLRRAPPPPPAGTPTMPSSPLPGLEAAAICSARVVGR